jgi:hypothetical protein
MRHFKHLAIIGGLALAGLATAGALRAFPSVIQWHDDPSTGSHCGAGDVFGTGSARDWGIQCSHCHINNKNQQGHLSLKNNKITWSPALDAAHPYVAGQIYQGTIAFVWDTPSEIVSNASQNKNGFALSIEDSQGNPAGNLRGDGQGSTSSLSACPATPPTLTGGATAPDPVIGQGTKTTYAYGDCHALVSLDYNPPATSWTFYWQAPSAAGQQLTLYYGLVDGDGDQSSLNDDVRQGKIQIQ